MKPRVQYFAETDTLAIEVARKPATEAEEVADDLIIEYDAKHNVVGITIEHASGLLGEAALQAERRSA